MTCSLMYPLYFSCYSLSLAMLGLSPTVSILSVMMVATELVKKLLCSSYTSMLAVAACLSGLVGLL